MAAVGSNYKARFGTVISYSRAFICTGKGQDMAIRTLEKMHRVTKDFFDC